MSDNENNGMEYEDSEGFETRSKLMRSPIKGECTRNTRARKLLSAEEFGKISAENDILRAENDELMQRVESLERLRPNYTGPRMREEQELTKIIGELSRRIEAMETRKRGIDRENGRDEYSYAREKASKVTEDPAERIVKIGDGTVTNAKLPRGGWLRSPFEDLTYKGRTDAQNPMKFLKRFEKIANYEGVETREQLYYFGKCMRGTASNWFDVRDPDSIEEAKEAFVDYFWSEEQQARFREEIYTGRFKTESNISMAEYALNVSKQAKYLVPPMSEHEIIRCVKRHFGPNIAREIRPSTVKTVEEFVTLLDELEYEQKKMQRVNYRAQNTTERNVGARRASSARMEQTAKGTNTRGQAEASAYRTAKPYVTRYGYYNNDRDNANAYRASKPYVNRGESSYDKRENETKNVPSSVKIEELPREDKGTANKEIVPYRKDVARRAEKPASGKTDLASRDRRSVASIEADRTNSEEMYEDEKNEKKIAIMRTQELIRDVDEVTEEDQRKTYATTMPYVTVTVGDRLTVKTLIDTGAQISAITKALYDKMTNEGVEMRIIPIKKFSLTGAFSDRGQPIAHRIQINFRIGETEFTHELYVVRNLAYEMILGIDFLTERKAILQCGKKFTVEFLEKDEEAWRGQLNAIAIEEADEILERILNDHSELFIDEIGCVEHYRHEIKMTNEKPFKGKTYPVPEIHRTKVKNHLLELERDGIVERAQTQFVNPLVVVIKKTGEIRLCLDAREINKRMANDHDQPPTIDEVFRRIGDKRYFTTLDVAKAFWQIPLQEESKRYTGFKFDNQTYVFRRLPFGLKTAGASFTRAMQRAIGDECDPFTIVYLDDILIASNSLEEHVFHVNYILERLKKVGFRLNREKCEFMKTEIRFLGHTFNQIKAEMNEDTKLAIQNFERPRNKKAIQAFLGLVNWDRRFVKNLARMTKPLERLLKKTEKFVWTEETQKAFAEIKRAFQDAPCLFVIRPGLKFGIYVDASKYGLGARLYQYGEDKPEERYTVAYASRSLKGAELNYTVTEIECLALVWALRKWHATLLGRHVKVHSDHRALKFLTACADDSARIARWTAFLHEFDLEICHVPGKENVIADTLSRNNVKNGFVKKEGNTKRIAALIQIADDEEETSQWTEMIANAQQEDERLQREIAEEPETLPTRDGLVRVTLNRGERIVVPEGIKWQLIDRVHKYLLHFGTDKICDFVERYFSIHNLERVVRDVVASCEICQSTKYYTRPSRGLEYYDLPCRPGETISIDLFGPLPQTPRGNKYVLVAMDQFSKLTKLFPIKNQKLETIMDTLQLEYFGRVGIPTEILTDNGGQFVTNRWREFAAEIGFSVRKTSPYNPQSNPVERVMREIGRVIRVYAHDHQTQWDRIIERTERTINATAHRSTGFMPVELHAGMEEPFRIDPRLKPMKEDDELNEGEPEEVEDEIVERRIEEARETLKTRAQQRKRQTDKHGEAEVYEEGKKVWIKLHRRSDANRRLTRKIHLVYDGPYKISREVRRNAYLIEDQDGNTLGTFNSRQLKPHREAKLKPTAQINMMKSNNEIGKISKKEISEFAKAIRQRRTDEGEQSEEILTVEEEDEVVTKTRDPENPRTGKEEEEGEQHLIEKKKSKISEKGMRHVSRLMKLISGKQPLQNLIGIVEGVEMKILLDFRGKFNVITGAAVELIESKVRKLRRIRNSESIPEYLKRERKIKIKAVELEVTIKQRKIVVEAMILSSNEICMLLGRQACREMGGKLREKPENKFELTRWSEHLTEATRKRLLMEEEREEKNVAEKRKSAMTYAKNVKRAKVSDEKLSFDETKKNDGDKEEEVSKDHGQQPGRRGCPMEEEDPEIIVMEDPVKGNTDADLSRESAVKVREIKGNKSKQCSESAEKDRQSESRNIREKTIEIETLRKISDKIELRNLGTLSNNGDRIRVKNLETLKSDRIKKSDKALETLKSDRTRANNIEVKTVENRKTEVIELNKLEERFKNLETMVKAFKQNKLKENRVELESVIKSLKKDIWEKLDKKESISLENNENITQSISSEESLEISITNSSNVIITSTPKSNEKQKNVTRQRENSICEFKIRNKNELNSSENSLEEIRDKELNLKENNILNNSKNEIEILSQSSFLNNLELERNSTKGIQIDQSTDTIIVENNNETIELNEQRKNLLEADRVKKVKDWIRNKVNSPKYIKENKAIDTNSLNRCKSEVEIKLNEIDIKNLEKKTNFKEKIQIIDINEEKINLSDISIDTANNNSEISRNDKLDNKNSSENNAKDERTIYEHTQYRWRANEIEANMKSNPKIKIQYGALTASRDKLRSECKDEIEPKEAKMDYKRELEKMREEEEALLRKIEKRAKLQSLVKQQRERIVVLRRLAGEEEREAIPTTREVDELTKREEQRAQEVSKVLFLTLQARNVERTFYKETVLTNKDDGAEYKISAIVSIRCVKDSSKVSKPINMNWTAKGNTMEGEVSFVEQSDVTIPKSVDKVIQHFRIDPAKKEEKETKKRSTKPRITSDVRVSIPRLKIDKTQVKHVKQSEQKTQQEDKENEEPNKMERKKTDSEQEIERLKELLARAQRKRSICSYLNDSSDDNANIDNTNNDSKELPRASKSRKSSLAGEMKPEVHTDQPATILRYRIEMEGQPDEPRVEQKDANEEERPMMGSTMEDTPRVEQIPEEAVRPEPTQQPAELTQSLKDIGGTKE
ncbi:reverse ribonuclease integrase [Lasius niger]|uniref:RNA-directed DNA polymerase n=1 Tax=Lasius niger TaxID=67767 RepID=A0A0J7KMZ3_LASNI|nr:reverse ribonuclease integrase [Lasius niger]